MYWLGVLQSGSTPTEGIGDSLPQEEVADEALGLKSGLNWKPPLRQKSKNLYMRRMEISDWWSMTTDDDLMEQLNMTLLTSMMNLMIVMHIDTILLVIMIEVVLSGRDWFNYMEKNK